LADQWKPGGGNDYKPVPANSQTSAFLSAKKKEFYLSMTYGAGFGLVYFWALMKFYAKRVEPSAEENLPFAAVVLTVFSVAVCLGSKYGHPNKKK
jgi:hypothetical protein